MLPTIQFSSIQLNSVVHLSAASWLASTRWRGVTGANDPGCGTWRRALQLNCVAELNRNVELN